MKPYDVEGMYREVYLHSNSQLEEGSVQDRELRRAWFVSLWYFIAWQMTSTDDTPNELFESHMNDVAREVDTFCIAHTTADERIPKS